MREILKEGDVISAEIQSVYNDGSLALHTRSVKYGKVSWNTEYGRWKYFLKINFVKNLICEVGSRNYAESILTSNQATEKSHS